MDNNTQQQLLGEILQLKHLMKRVKNITTTNETNYITHKHYIKDEIIGHCSITKIIIIAIRHPLFIFIREIYLLLFCTNRKCCMRHCTQAILWNKFSCFTTYTISLILYSHQCSLQLLNEIQLTFSQML